MTGEQKITLGEMRSAGVHNVLIYCADHRCGHCVTIEACADRWPDDVRLRSALVIPAVLVPP